MSQDQQPTARAAGWPSKPYPALTFESVLPLAQAIYDRAGASREMKRVTVFRLLGKAAESGPSRNLVANSGKYGLTTGGRSAEVLKLSYEAVRIFDPNRIPSLVTRTKFTLAIERIGPFKALYEKFKGGKLPAIEVMKDALQDIKPEERQEVVDIFIGNAKYIGLLGVRDGAEWMLRIDDVAVPAPQDSTEPTPASGGIAGIVPTNSDYSTICFFIAPIGDEGSPERKHSDMVLETLVEEAIAPFKLRVVRADKITSPGTISKQIIEHIMRSRLVIVDMSFHNPYLFSVKMYPVEAGLRS